MLRSRLKPALFIVHSPQSRNGGPSLPVHMSRGKFKGHVHCLFYYMTADRHSVTEKNNFFSHPVKLLRQIPDIRRPLLPHHFERIQKTVESRIYLAAPCIHNRADQSVCAVKVIGHGIHGWNVDQRLIQGQPQPFSRRRTDAKSGKGAWTSGNGNGIHGVKFHLKQPHHLINHRQKCLGMRLLKVDRIFRRNHIIRYNRHRGHQG